MEKAPRNLAVLFADISGSAKLYETLGDAEALATVERCLAIIEQACVDSGGRIVKTIGDEVMAVFHAADGAARAATDMQARISSQRTARGAPLAIHVGFNFGPVLEEGNDVFGDAVTIAARLANLARGGQVFTSAPTVAELAPGLRARTRSQQAHTVKGKQKDIDLFELVWQETEDELTALSTHVKLRPAHLTLTHGERRIELSEAMPALSIGRDLQNDVVIADRKASRMHARIERRRDKFVLIDHSSNGTYVTVQGEAEILLRREELILRNRGQMSFGHAYRDDTAEFLGFSCLD
ncbi:MAG TPA: adenylate/guanylate cyclase domain-containing protein [Casimicrobiaceae bacterium]